ncbi:hypothetical protein LshimejAT787_1104290 [Lyophyllum shimeji]|uniref:C2 domain-containing protein n=1 Tax=Lyophyllum shimeji TaxID=47721 RepID=A0A9P3UP69_LYOSH|nr:hypothetical protein LshimejAT787_1104290 [Lyophyllum shimeji]
MKLYPNPLRRPIQLGRYDQVLIEVLHAENLPPRPHVHATVTVDDVKYTTKISTNSQNPRWSNERFTMPLFRSLGLEVTIYHSDEVLGISWVPINRMLEYPEGVCELDLYMPGIVSDNPGRPRSMVTLRATKVSTFIAKSLPQYRLSPGLALPSFPHASLLSSPVFHPPPDSVRRVLTALEEARLANHVEHKVVVISESLVVKLGAPRYAVREAMAMIYIQQRTSIPIPTVHMCFEHNSRTYIVMDRVKGRCLDDALPDTTSQCLRSFATQLASFVRELRTLDPRTTMGSWPAGPYDNLFFDPPPLHEFRAMGEFHSYWIWRLGTEMSLPEVPSSLRDVHRPYRVVLTHGDLAPRNIMVDGDLITGLVDWETLGWYPDFWELMAATRSSGKNMDIWIDELSTQLGPLSEVEDQYVSVLHDVAFRFWAD